MLGHLFPLSPGCASLTEDYAHLATPWQRTYSLIFQIHEHQFEKIEVCCVVTYFNFLGAYADNHFILF